MRSSFGSVSPSFQSTLPYGSDSPRFFVLISIAISIHAPLRERPCCRKTCPPKYRFQSTLPYGSDKPRRKHLVRRRNFNPRSLTGATSAVGQHSYLPKFQSTLPYGSDISAAELWTQQSVFQSTLPYGSDHSVAVLCGLA